MMKRVLILAALGEALTGLALLLVPSLVGQVLLGERLTGVTIPVARVGSIALIALSIACWPGPPAVGMLFYVAGVALYLAYVGFMHGLTGILLWPAVVLHLVLSALLRSWALSSPFSRKIRPHASFHCPPAQDYARAAPRLLVYLCQGFRTFAVIFGLLLSAKPARLGRDPWEEIAMHRLTVTSLAALGICALTSCASQPPPAATAANLGATEGTVTFSGGALAVGVGFQWGNGTLTYQGQQYPFRMNGLSVLDVGISSITGSGTVHNLNKVADFSGNYVSVTAGATVAGGGSVTSLRNQNGVVIDGITTAQGVRFTLAPGGVNISLTGQPSS